MESQTFADLAASWWGPRQEPTYDEMPPPFAWKHHLAQAYRIWIGGTAHDEIAYYEAISGPHAPSATDAAGRCERSSPRPTDDTPDREPLTLADLWLWLDTITRQYGHDLPLYVQPARADAPAEVCLDAHVQREPGGERVVVLSARPPREG